MSVVSVAEAGMNLSKLVEAVESGAEREIVIARNGKPAARLVPISDARDTSKRIGLLKGKFRAPDDFDADNEEIARSFIGQ